mmetsp:Transcript_3974/g.9409  ORF Transcript_3974/g.9409 Transcript_3974/m.9409 type:complete len:206 (-) Transcript_3974:2744-3361(-)
MPLFSLILFRCRLLILVVGLASSTSWGGVAGVLAVTTSPPGVVLGVVVTLVVLIVGVARVAVLLLICASKSTHPVLLLVLTLTPAAAVAATSAGRRTTRFLGSRVAPALVRSRRRGGKLFLQCFIPLLHLLEATFGLVCPTVLVGMHSHCHLLVSVCELPLRGPLLQAEIIPVAPLRDSFQGGPALGVLLRVGNQSLPQLMYQAM